MDLSSGPTINFNNQINNSKVFKLSFENNEYLIQLGVEDKKLKVTGRDTGATCREFADYVKDTLAEKFAD